MPIDGGEPQQLTDKPSTESVISPDGKLIACFHEDPDSPGRWVIAIIPIAGGEPTLVFKMPEGISEYAPLRWSPDGNAITYVVDRGGVSNIWGQPLDGNHAQQLTNFKEKLIFAFDWSRDGALACARGNVENDVVLIRDVR